MAVALAGTVPVAPAVAQAVVEAPALRFEASAADIDAAVEQLLGAMTQAEKIGQMCQAAPELKQPLTAKLRESIERGEVGSLINVPDKAFAEEAQRVARVESRLGIPLLVGRDVIHGYRTLFPVPLGQAASWDPELIERAAHLAAEEAKSQGINWTFAPMVDIGRDPRWGRIAETLGEDPLLAGALAGAMVRGFQQERDGRLHGLAACVKHFAAYGLSEGGRDYNRASLSNLDLHNVYLPPFRAAADAGCRTLMTTFSEVNGVPGTAHHYLLRDVLKGSWKFRGLVVSDWNSIIEMIQHGYSADAAEAARQAANAGVDMEMVSPTYQEHLATLVERGAVPQEAIDDAVRRILRVKFELFGAKAGVVPRRGLLRPQSLELARKAARESIVLLKNENKVLPLQSDAIKRLAVIGPLADAPQSQLGCWAPDGVADDTVTPLEALKNALGESVEISYARGAAADFSRDANGIEEARQTAAEADAALLFVGEDAVLSGEAKSRSDLQLPGVQSKLVREVAAAGKPTVMIVMAGRPLAIGAECAAVDAVLYAWHPGTMGGPAIADLVLGIVSPSGKLPVTFPKSVGQVPLYYAHSNTGRPASKDYKALAATGGKELPAEQQYQSHYLDSDPFPQFPFGFGLTYTTFAYDGLELNADSLQPGESLNIRALVTNTGDRAGTEIVQLYVRDLVASAARPVKELKAFRRVHLRAGESKEVEFTLDSKELAYLDADGKPVLEPGEFAIGVGGSSAIELNGRFEVTSGASTEEPATEEVARRPQPDEAQRNGKRAE
jgi:beta-glucosidase